MKLNKFQNFKLVVKKVLVHWTAYMYVCNNQFFDIMCSRITTENEHAEYEDEGVRSQVVIKSKRE